MVERSKHLFGEQGGATSAVFFVETGDQREELPQNAFPGFQRLHDFIIKSDLRENFFHRHAQGKRQHRHDAGNERLIGQLSMV